MKQFKIEENDANQRLDKFLKKLFVNATRGLIFKLNRKGKIKVNWKKKDNEYKLEIWDEVKIFLRDEEFNELTTALVSVVKPISEKLKKSDIVYEDKEVLVINKNPNLNVHPWDHKTKEISLIEQVHDYLSPSLNSLTFKPALAHRIDRDTSWAIVVWKQKHILEWLVSDFKNKKVQKTYYALVLGKLSRPKWTISKKLIRIENAKNENKVQVSDKWQTAVTHYNVLNEYKLKTPEWEILISAVEVNIETWRMHQIRVHMAHIWNPILGDSKYWDIKLNHYLNKEGLVTRQMLHSWKLEFYHKWKSKNIKVEARFKDDMESFLRKCK